jgi:hypothetical protein
MSTRSGGGGCVEVRSAPWRERHGRQPWCWFEPHRGRSRTDETGDRVWSWWPEERDHEVSILMSRTGAVARY